MLNDTNVNDIIHLTSSIISLLLSMEFKTAKLDLTGRIVSVFVVLLMLAMSIFFSLKVPYGIFFLPLFFSIPFVSYLLAPKKYYIDSHNIVIEKVIGRKIHLPLKDITACTFIPDASKLRLLRAFGNGGLFAYYGIFSSAEFGSINLQVTQWRNIILIKTLKGLYGISPVNAEDFQARIDAYCPSISHELKIIKRSEPRLDSGIQTAILCIPIAIFIITLGAVLILYHRLPHQIAVHFNLHGDPDRWGGRISYLFGHMLPAVITFLLNLGIYTMTWKSQFNTKVTNMLVLLLSTVQLLILYIAVDTYWININQVHLIPFGVVLITFVLILISLGLIYYKEVKK